MDDNLMNSLQKEIDLLNNKTMQYYNFIATPEKYDDRVFFLSMCTEAAIDDFLSLFPNSYQKIRESVLTRIIAYINKTITFDARQVLTFDDNSENFDLFLLEKDKLIMTILLPKREIVISNPPRIEEIERVEIPSLENKISLLAEAISNKENDLDEDLITDAKTYASKIFLPKRHTKKVNKTILSYQNEIYLYTEQINALNQELDQYYQSPVYKQKKKIADKIYSIIALKKVWERWIKL